MTTTRPTVPTITNAAEVDAFERCTQSNRTVAKYGFGACIRAAVLAAYGEGPTVIRIETGMHWRAQANAIRFGKRVVWQAQMSMSEAVYAEWLRRWDVPASIANRLVTA